MATDESPADRVKLDSGGKVFDRRLQLLVVAISTSAALLGTSLGALVSVLTTKEQLSSQQATAQAEFIRENRQSVYARFVDQATAFQLKAHDLSTALDTEVASEELIGAAQAALLKLRAELGLTNAAVRLVGREPTVTQAEIVFLLIEGVVTTVGGEPSDILDAVAGEKRRDAIMAFRDDAPAKNPLAPPDTIAIPPLPPLPTYFVLGSEIGEFIVRARSDLAIPW